ncbi:MAG: lipid IV(A) 3-deoxy-D-manno-octulosonic acid transferase [Pseudomonadales bacterium]
MWQSVYQGALKIAEPLVRLRLRRRARREPAYGERIEERFGAVPTSVPAGVIWFHTVSAGETIAAAPLIAQLQAQYSQAPFLVTTMTPTGSAQVKQHLGDRVHHCYAPYDFRHAVDAFYERVQPRLLVLMETELWPNLIAGARQRDIPVLLVNGRLSEKSARGYARVGSLARSMLAQLTAIGVQEPRHRERFVALGADPERVQVTGNLKFDHTLAADYEARLTALYRQLPLSGRWVWIAASTHAGEDQQVLLAHQQLREHYSQALLLLVPRHPVRAPEVLALAAAAGLNATLQTTLEDCDDLAALDVVIADTMGQLGLLYGLAECAFVGGSLVEHGGHNPIEPALCSCPVLMGPSRHNFTAVCEAFAEQQALGLVADADALGGRLLAYAGDAALAAADGARALEVVAANRGARGRIRALLEPYLPAG